jgi:sirohydrochlorin ferrochelatase
VTARDASTGRRRAILLVDHGSRRAEANAVIEEVAAALRARAPGCIVEVAHLEIAPPSVEAAVDACVAAGATEVVVHPYFLAPGVHTRRDIPERLAASALRHPDVSFRSTEPLGFHDRIVDVVLDRVEED